MALKEVKEENSKKRETEENEPDLRWHKLQLRVFEDRIEKVFAFFHKSGIEPILIKGWAAASNYPEPALRLFSDIDLAVAPDDFEKAEKLFKDNRENLGNLDLHRGLRHLDTTAWEDLFKNSRIVQIGGAGVRILRPEDHLRVLSIHWLTDGGAYRERLWDIFYAVENRPEDFDWARCLNIVSPRRRRWIVCTIGLAGRYLGLDLKETPIAVEAGNLPAWLMKTVESEWQSDIKLKPLHLCLKSKREFFSQIRKRIPPNRIQATIEMEGDFDKNTRFFYQFGSVFTRIIPSLKRLTGALMPKRNA